MMMMIIIIMIIIIIIIIRHLYSAIESEDRPTEMMMVAA